MEGYTRRSGWALALGAVLLSVIAGAIAYNIGLSEGIAQSAAAQGGTLPPGAYGWHRHWGFGFGFPLLLIFFWLFVVRAMCWGGFWWRSRYYRDPSYMPWAFDEWHRRAHEHMKEGPSADDSGRRG